MVLFEIQSAVTILDVPHVVLHVVPYVNSHVVAHVPHMVPKHCTTGNMELVQRPQCGCDQNC